MKKYFFLICLAVLGFVLVSQIPTISDSVSKECAVASVFSGEASEYISCKGIVEDFNENFLVNIQIGEEDVGKISVGMPANITCKALGDKVLNGKVESIGDFAYKISYGDISQTVIDAVVSFDGNYDELKSGYTASVDIIYTKIKDAYILPFDCVAQEKSGEYYVYKINENWAVKEYVDIAFEDEKGAVLSGKCDFKTVCEQPENLFGDYVRIKNVRSD